MKLKLFSFIIMATVTIYGYGYSAERVLPTKYTSAEKVYAFSTVWSELKYNFVYIDHIDFNPDSLYLSYLPQILETRNDVEYFNLMKKFIARFNDGHTSVLRYSYHWDEVYDFAPLMFEELNGRYFISGINDSPQLDSLALGAEVVRIDGVPTREYVKEHYFPFIAAGSENEKYNIAANEIGTGFPGSYFKADLKYRDGRTVPVCIENNYYQLTRENRLGQQRNWKGFGSWQRDAIVLSWPQEHVARLNFSRFDNESIPLLDSLFTAISTQADALIIDLRDCEGGSSIVGDKIAARIIDADYLLTGGSRVRTNNGYGRAQGNYRPEYEDDYNYRAYKIYPSDTITIDRSKVLKCPVIILTSRATVSAAETFLIRIVELQKRPLIIGQQTNGSTGAPLVLELAHDACVRICTRCQLFPLSGKPFVNDGIRPDIEIIPTVEDYMSGYDRVLEEALKKINTGMAVRNI